MLINKPIPLGYILNKVKIDLFYVLAVSAMVLAMTTKFNHVLPEMPLTIPAFIGTAISILLSFKLSQSYDRWWEARKIWGSIVNDSRSLVLQLQSFLPAGNENFIRTMALRQAAWCYSLGQSLRGLDPLQNTEGLVAAEEIARVREHTNKPLALLQQHSLDMRRLREEDKLPLYAHVQLDSTITRLCDAQGRAERIKSTVFPVTYRLFLHLTIYLFVITLSISLRNVPAFFEIPLLLLISSAFFLLEKTASHMQDPFENQPTDTAMTTIARNIEINLRQLTGTPPVPEPLKPEEFYIL